MIRPFTCLAVIIAGGVTLYVYQAKHDAQLLDREIGRVVAATEAARARSGALRAEWALLNDPTRLQGLADQHLTLKPMLPGQYVQLADLDKRLPAPVVPVPSEAGTTDDDEAAAPAMTAPAAPAIGESAPVAAVPAPPVPGTEAPRTDKPAAEKQPDKPVDRQTTLAAPAAAPAAKPRPLAPAKPAAPAIIALAPAPAAIAPPAVPAPAASAPAAPAIPERRDVSLLGMARSLPPPRPAAPAVPALAAAQPYPSAPVVRTASRQQAAYAPAGRGYAAPTGSAIGTSSLGTSALGASALGSARDNVAPPVPLAGDDSGSWR